MTPRNMYFLFLQPVSSICFLYLVTFLGMCDGVTLYVNSRFPPPPPFVTTLYRAPQTYDRGKSSKAPRPFILISKVRPCYYHSESGRHFGLARPGSMARPQDHRRIVTTSVPTQWPIWASSMGQTDQQFRQHPWPVRWSASRSPPLTSYSNPEFKGNWQIIKPILKENIGGQVIKYNKDGTRVVPEIMYKYHTREPQIVSNKLQNITTTVVNVETDESITTAQPSPLSTSDTTITNLPTTAFPRISLTAQYQVFGSTKQLQIETTTVPEVITTTFVSSSTDQATTLAVSSTFKPTARTLKSSTTTRKSAAIPTLSPIPVVTSFLVHDVVQNTDAEKSKDTIISKLGGGAKNVLNSIFGGLLNNHRKTDMIKGKNKVGDIFNYDNYTVDSQEWATEHGNNHTERYNLSLSTNKASQTVPTSETGITTQMPNSILDHFHFLQELQSLEEHNVTGYSSQAHSNNLTNINLSQPMATIYTDLITTTPIPFTVSENSTHMDLASIFMPHEEISTSSSLGGIFNSTYKEPWSLDQSPEYEQDPIPTLEPQWSEEDNRTKEGEEDYPELFPLMTSAEIVPEMPDSPSSKAPTPLQPIKNGKNNSPNFCPDCEEDEYNMETTDNGLATSTSGWRPLRRPLPYKPDPPKAPAPGPFSIHHWLHSTWNDTFDWWKEKPDEDDVRESGNTTVKSASKSWFTKVYNNTSTDHPNLDDKGAVTTYRPSKGLSPIHWLFGLKENDGTTGKEQSYSNETKNVSSALQLFEELLAESEEANVETRVKEGVEILDAPKSRKQPTKLVNVQMDGRESSFEQVLQSDPSEKRTVHSTNTSTSSNETKVPVSNHSKNIVTSQERLKLDRSSEDGDVELEDKLNSNQSQSPTEMITEISKFYSKLSLRLPLPFDIMEPLITMRYEALTKDNYFYDKE